MFERFHRWVHEISVWISSCVGRSRFGVAFFAGGVSVLALPPFHFWFVPFATFPVIVWLLDGAGRNAFLSFRARFLAGGFVGWAFGCGYFFFGLYWIGSAFLVEIYKFGWMIPFALGFLSAGIALFYGLATGVAFLFWRSDASRIAALAASFGLAEWIRGHVLTGFPWNSIGYSLTGLETVLQAASVVGLYGLGVVAVAIYSLPSLFFGINAHSYRGRVAFCAVIVGLFVTAFAYGYARIPSEAQPLVDGVRLRIVQPNIAQVDKWRRDKQQEIFNRFLDLSLRDEAMEKSGLNETTHLIWPESALPFLLARSEVAKTAIGAILPSGITLMTGALRMEERVSASGQVSEHVYNSLFVADSKVQISSTYDKIHLVPFGEYLPFHETMERFGLQALTGIRGGLKLGKGPRYLEVPGAPSASPQICYEIIFPGEIVDLKKPRPGWILNVTNDAWFGVSSGPYQHLHQARVRAIEEGLPVVRSANTGVSAVIDPYGRFVKWLPLNAAGVIDSGLPAALPETFFARNQNLGFCFLVLLMIIVGAAFRYFNSRGAQA